MSGADIIERLREVEATLKGRDREAVGHAIERLLAMSEQLEAFKKSMASRFRPSSEKVDPGQLTLELLGFMAQHGGSTAPAPGSPEGSERDLDEHPQKPPRKKRASGVKLLPVEKVTIPLSPNAKGCRCGQVMKSMGYDVSRQIVYVKGRIFMLEEHLEKAGCGACKEEVHTAEGTPKPIDGGLASSSLLAHIATRKCVDAVPVERTGRILAREGAELAPSTLHDWFAFTGKQAGLIASVAHAELLESTLISLDDTPLLSKKHDDRDGTQRGRLWMYVGDVSRVAVCRFTPDWKGTHPAEVLEGFKGRVQLDGYGGLNPLFKANTGLQRMGCNDHCRRHFVQALKEGDKRAASVVDIYRGLYEVEAVARSRKLEPDELLEWRTERARPLWAKLGAAIEALDGHVSRKSALGKGVSYWRKQRPFLEGYLEDPYVPISNVHVEQLIRTIALFRKNSLFVGNTEAGERFANLMTLMVNCALCGANPEAYLTDILTRLATGWPAKKIAALMPQAWLAAQKDAQQPAAA